MATSSRSTLQHPLTRGDRVPDFVLPNQHGVGISLYDRARGKPIVVAFCDAAAETTARQLRRLAEWCGDHPRARAHCFVLTRASEEAVRGAAGAYDFPGSILRDVDGHGAAAFGLAWAELEERPRLYVLDPNQRLLAEFAEGGETGAERAREYVEGLALFAQAVRPRDIAPVLMIPRVFEPEFCTHLIEAFHTRGHEESGVYSLEEGELRHEVDHRMKKRFDHYVRDEDLVAEITRRLSRRVLPEIDKAYCYRVTKLEEFKIVCYRATAQGYFRAHRDNFSPQTVHRRFAMTLNLNAGEYEGGELRFPEYGPHLYSPGRGEAIVFSCSLVHEALDVARGDRYVLLAFLYGEDGARQKREMQRRMQAAGRE